MAKFKVLKKFRDIETKKIYEPESVIELTVKRSEEVAKNLDDTYLERIKEDGSKADKPFAEPDKGADKEK